MNKTRKLFAFALIFVLLVSCFLGATAFAESESTIKIPQVDLIPDSNGIIKIENHLYEISFDSIDYSCAEDLMSDMNAVGCSSVRNCNYYGRNLDWYFDDGIEMIVHTKGDEEHYATLGVVGAIPSINTNSIEDGSIREHLAAIPFAIVDGINEKGVFINVNVVPGEDLGERGNTVVMPEGEVEDTINCGYLVRYVLDNFASAPEAVEYLTQHVSITKNEMLTALGFETHYMLGDEQHTYILEMIDNKLVAQCTDIDCDSKLAGRPIMTNFYLNLPEVEFNEDGTVRTNHDGKPNESNITPHGAGLERYNLAVKEYKDADTFLGMMKLMMDLYYSRTYNMNMEDYWYSESSHGDLTNSSKLEDYPTDDKLENSFWFRDRGKGYDSIWITTHMSIYDISARELYITVQEEMTGYRFSFK